MRAVLRGVALLMGVALVGLTALLGLSGAMQQTFPVALFSLNESTTRWAPNVVWVAIGMDSKRAVLPPTTDDNPIYSPLGWSPDGTWYYIKSSRAMDETVTDTGEVWRIRCDGKQVQRLPGVMVTGQITWATNGEWMVYASLSPGQTAQLFRASPDGQVIEPLFTGFDRHAIAPVVSVDGQWVYFRGITSDERRQDVFRVSMNTGTPENLTKTFGIRQEVVAWPTDSNWLVVTQETAHEHWQLYALAINATDWRLIQSPIASGGPPYGNIIPTTSQLIVTTVGWQYGHLLSIDVAANAFLWRVEQVRDASISPGSQWILLDYKDGRYARMHLDGTDYIEFPDMPSELDQLGYLPDSQLAIYGGFDDHFQQYSVYQLHLASGELRQLAVDDHIIHVAGFSADGDWIVLHHEEPFYYQWIRPESGEVTFTEIADPDVVYFTTLPDLVRESSPIGLLILGGVLTVGGMVRRKGRSKT